MEKAPSKEFQYKAVSAGVALGLCVAEQYIIPGAKLPLESAFKRAWQRWAHKGSFPAVGKVFDFSVPTRDPYLVLISNNERTLTPRVPFYWGRGGLGYQVFGRDGWEWDSSEQSELDFVAELLTDGPTVPAGAWADLATDMLTELAAKE